MYIRYSVHCMYIQAYSCILICIYMLSSPPPLLLLTSSRPHVLTSSRPRVLASSRPLLSSPWSPSATLILSSATLSLEPVSSTSICKPQSATKIYKSRRSWNHRVFTFFSPFFHRFFFFFPFPSVNLKFTNRRSSRNDLSNFFFLLSVNLKAHSVYHTRSS